MDTHTANLTALSGFAEKVREALKELGMRRCSIRLVYRQCEECDTHLNWSQLFRRWVAAVRRAHHAGADLIVNDFNGWYESLCAGEELLACDWEGAVDACVDEHGDVIKEAIRADDMEAVVRESSEAITAYRRLIAIAHARAEYKAQARNRRAVARVASGARGGRPQVVPPHTFEVGRWEVLSAGNQRGQRRRSRS